MSVHPNARELAESTTILRGVVGSTVHGLAVSDQDDRDEMGICVEPWEHYFGLRPRFEQWSYRTKPEGVRSGPGDLDLIVYSLAKWARLALKGNPTVLTLLFLPLSAIVKTTTLGEGLVAMRDAFVSRHAIAAHLGYMREQRGRMENKRRRPNRPELIERYGYDTKYAGHVLRLGYQGIEIATTRRLTLPMSEAHRTRIIDVRTGKVSERDVLAEARELEDELVALRDESTLGEPGTERVERFVLDAYMERNDANE